MICPNCNLPRYYGPTGLAAPQCSCVHSYQPPKRTLPQELLARCRKAIDCMSAMLPNEVDNAALLAAIDAAAPAPTAKESLTRSQRMAAAGFAARDRRLPCDECGKLFSVQMLPVHKCEPAGEAADQIEAEAAQAQQAAPLTQAQRIRLWDNSPQVHGDVVGRDAFERLVKLVESVHRIGASSGSAS